MSSDSKVMKRLVCGKAACWNRGEIIDSTGVKAVLGNGWDGFQLDDHFRNKHGCVAKRVGALCDGVAARVQEPPRRSVWLIEVKRAARVSKAKDQLINGGRKVRECWPEASIEKATLFCLHVPKLTTRPGRWISIEGKRVPFHVEKAS